jgi:hypothetical protein
MRSRAAKPVVEVDAELMDSNFEWSSVMAVTLNRRAFNHAKDLIDEGRFVFDERDAWSEHRPSAQDENEFLRLHGFTEFGKWYLGINDQRPEDTKGHYEFPYGDFEKVHRCGVLSAESRAGQYKHFDIENAAAHLHGMIDGRKSAAPSKQFRDAAKVRKLHT